MTDVAKEILKKRSMMKDLEQRRMVENEQLKDLAVDVAFDVLENHEDGIYIMRFPLEKYDFDIISKFFTVVSNVLSSKKLVAVPYGVSVRSLSKEQAREIAEELMRYAEE